MQSLSIDRPATAAGFLRDLVAILRTDGGPTWRLLVSATSNRTATIDFDGVLLRVTGRAAPEYDLRIEAGIPSAPLSFKTDAQTIRDLIAGRLTLDRALADGHLFVRGSLTELLGMYRLALRILADSATNPALRRLCIDFDATWPAPPEPAAPTPLQHQLARVGYLVARIPDDVLRVELP